MPSCRMCSSTGQPPVAGGGARSVNSDAAPRPRARRVVSGAAPVRAEKGPAATAGPTLLTSDMEPLPRAGGVTCRAAPVRAEKSQQRSQALRSYERCGAVPSCRWWSRAVPPTVRAGRARSVDSVAAPCHRASEVRRLPAVRGDVHGDARPGSDHGHDGHATGDHQPCGEMSSANPAFRLSSGRSAAEVPAIAGLGELPLVAPVVWLRVATRMPAASTWQCVATPCRWRAQADRLHRMKCCGRGGVSYAAAGLCA